MAESVETLNQRLIDYFGVDTASNNPIWRIVKAGEQTEMRHGTYEDYTTNGLFIRRVTETREVPKYQSHRNCWVLEWLTAIPVINLVDLPATKVSYEPIWFYYHQKTGEPLPPIWSVTKLVINSHTLGRGAGNPFAKYKDTSAEEKEKELAEMMDYLYGDRNDTTDALMYKEGVVVPSKFFGE